LIPNSAKHRSENVWERILLKFRDLDYFSLSTDCSAYLPIVLFIYKGDISMPIHPRLSGTMSMRIHTSEYRLSLLPPGAMATSSPAFRAATHSS